MPARRDCRRDFDANCRITLLDPDLSDDCILASQRPLALRFGLDTKALPSQADVHGFADVQVHLSAASSHHVHGYVQKILHRSYASFIRQLRIVERMGRTPANRQLTDRNKSSVFPVPVRSSSRIGAHRCCTKVGYKFIGYAICVRRDPSFDLAIIWLKKFYTIELDVAECRRVSCTQRLKPYQWSNGTKIDLRKKPQAESTKIHSGTPRTRPPTQHGGDGFPWPG